MLAILLILAVATHCAPFAPTADEPPLHVPHSPGVPLTVGQLAPMELAAALPSFHASPVEFPLPLAHHILPALDAGTVTPAAAAHAAPPAACV